MPPGNSQAKVDAFAEEVLLKVTLNGAQPLVDPLTLNPAVGGVTMVTVCVAVEVPQALVAVSTTL